MILKQIGVLERLADEYKIPLPPRPPKNPYIYDSTEFMRDEHIYRIIFDGAQSAFDVHTKSIKLTSSDKLRKIFRDFFMQELDNYESLIKYGKFKGWVKNPPQYHANN